MNSATKYELENLNAYLNRRDSYLESIYKIEKLKDEMVDGFIILEINKMLKSIKVGVKEIEDICIPDLLDKINMSLKFKDEEREND